jgi:hypothetical protein
LSRSVDLLIDPIDNAMEVMRHVEQDLSRNDTTCQLAANVVDDRNVVHVMRGAGFGKVCEHDLIIKDGIEFANRRMWHGADDG